MPKQISENQGRTVANLYLGKLQRRKLSVDECIDEIGRKLKREGYDRGSIAGVQNEFYYLAEQYKNL